MEEQLARGGRSPKKRRLNSPTPDDQHQSELVKQIMEAINGGQTTSDTNNNTLKENQISTVQYPPDLSSSAAICRVFLPSSGRRGFDTVKTSSELPPVEIVREMINYETNLRLSPPIQEILDQYRLDEKSLT